MSNVMLTTLNAAQAGAFRAAGHWRDDTIYALARANAEKSPGKTALLTRHGVTTYRALIEAADALGAKLDARGLAPGARVAVWLPSRVETAVALLACSRNGYVCCPSLHRDHTVGDIVELLARMRASALIAETGYGADAARHDIFEAAAKIASLKSIHRLAPASAGDAPPWAGAAREAASMKTDPDTIVYLAFTSGTTGVPKGVMHSDNTLLANARALSEDWNLYKDSVIYSLGPLSHNLGLGALIMTLIRGGTFVVHDRARGESLVDRVVETGVRFLFGVPTHAIDLLAEMKSRGLRKLGEVRGFRVSGASVPPSVAAGLLDHGVTPQSGYGMTEAGSHQYTMPDDDAARICETSGRARGGYEVRIFAQDDPERELPAGEVGQICGRGASLMLGYFGDQEATENSYNKSGWFMTGDIGWMDPEGYLRVTGRKKDLIIRGGHNIYPARIEGLALRHEAIERAVALPVPDDRLGEKVCLVITCRGGQKLDAGTVLRHLDEAGLSKFDMPEYFLALDHIPLTPGGKILKRELVAAVAEGRLRPEPVRFTTGEPT